MKLSVIIPVYNAAKFLSVCLDSLCQQTDSDFEVIMINDGSTDSSQIICEEYAAKDVHFHLLVQDNSGVSSARNLGIEHAQGEWISFVDADDIVEKNYVELFLSQQRKADLTFFPHQSFSSDGQSRDYRMPASFSTGDEAMEQTILQLKENDQKFEFFGYTWNKFFRASIIREHSIRFRKGLKFREDEVFTAEYCRYITSIATLDIPLYKYRLGTGGLTSKKMNASDFLELAALTEENARYFSFSPLKKYENYRIMYMLYDALLAASSWSERCVIAKSIRSFNVRCDAQYDATRLPYGLVKNANSPWRLLLWWMRRGKTL